MSERERYGFLAEYGHVPARADTTPLSPLSNPLTHFPVRWPRSCGRPGPVSAGLAGCRGQKCSCCTWATGLCRCLRASLWTDSTVSPVGGNRITRRFSILGTFRARKIKSKSESPAALPVCTRCPGSILPVAGNGSTTLCCAWAPSNRCHLKQDTRWSIVN